MRAEKCEARRRDYNEQRDRQLPGGRVADASLAGRDPTTDVAVLRFQPDGLRWRRCVSRHRPRRTPRRRVVPVTHQDASASRLYVDAATRQLNAPEHASTWSRRSVKGASEQVVDRA
jgi:hypothetical protein